MFSQLLSYVSEQVGLLRRLLTLLSGRVGLLSKALMLLSGQVTRFSEHPSKNTTDPVTARNGVGKIKFSKEIFNASR